MKYTHIKVYKYKRFPLSAKEEFEHHFTKKLTMIVGPNGAGKSSLMGLLSTLPPEKDDFYKGGYLHLTLTHLGHEYRLMFDYTGNSPKYFFYMDGENLNQSANVSSQRELAFQHFNIVPVVQDLLTGAENFTDMSLINRKKLFNAITHLNIESVLDNYEDLKGKLKNQEFLLKNVTSLLLTEKQKLADTSRIETLMTEQSNARDVLNHLLAFRTELHQYGNKYDLHSSMTSLKGLTDMFKRVYHNSYNYITSYSREQIPELREVALTTIASAKTKLDGLFSEIEKIDTQQRSLAAAAEQDVKAMKARRSELELIISRTLSSISYITEDMFNDSVRNSVLVLEHSMADVISQLPENKDGKLGKTVYSELLQLQGEYQRSLNSLLESEIIEVRKLEELRSHQSLTCPNCAHSWLPGETDKLIVESEKKLKDIITEKATVQQKLVSIVPDIKKNEEYLTIYSQLVNLFNSTKDSLRPYWRDILDNGWMSTEPTRLLAKLRNLQNDVLACESLLEYRKELAALSDKINIIGEVGDKSVQDLNLQRTQVENEIDELYTLVNAQESHLNDYTLASSYYESLANISGLIETAKEALRTDCLSLMTCKLLEITDNELSLLKVRIIEIDKELNAQQMVSNTVAMYEKQLEGINEHVKVLNILTDELSPKNGLIAKTISSSLNVIIRSINNVIAGFWSYKMELRVINVEEDVLNYKFRVVVEDKLEIEDISKISSGMKEATNLGMKITLFKLLRLTDYPMYLDEFGVKLDKQHRARVADIIFKMIGSSVYSQIFLITHLDMAYTDFKDTEVIELSA